MTDISSNTDNHTTSAPAASTSGQVAPHVVVVGAGILGLSIATELAAKGARVTVIDRGHPVGGTSGTSFAWVNSNGKEPRGYHDLNVAGLRGHLEWQKNLPEALRWFRQTGAYEWTRGDNGAEELEQRVHTLRKTGYAADIVTAEQVRLANPGLRVPDGVIAAFADEGYVEVPRLAAWALLKLKDAGAALRFGQSIVQIERNKNSVKLHLENGDRITADRLVLAAGRWTRPLLDELGHRFNAPEPMDTTPHVRSILAFTAPLPVQLQSLIFTSGLNVRPDGGGRLVLQSIELDQNLSAESDLSTTGTLAGEYRRRLGLLLPFLPDNVVQEFRIGRRSMTGDGLPAIGWLEDNIYLVATHSGVTLAPAIADIATLEVLLDKERDAVAAFRPQRLLEAASAGKERITTLHSAQ